MISFAVPPTITRDASLLTSSVGDTLNMPCEAYGIPEPVIQWYKDSRQINNDSLRHNIDINGTLTILKLQVRPYLLNVLVTFFMWYPQLSFF